MTAERGPVAVAVRRVIYVSTPHEALAVREIPRIATTSRRNNRTSAISGVLLYTGRRFAAVLEGPPSALDALLERILRDERHRDVRIVADATSSAEARWFKGWGLGFLYSPPEIARIESLAASRTPDRETMEAWRAIFTGAETF